jgi:hypothetical protein
MLAFTWLTINECQITFVKTVLIGSFLQSYMYTTQNTVVAYFCKEGGKYTYSIGELLPDLLI